MRKLLILVTTVALVLGAVSTAFADVNGPIVPMSTRIGR